MQLSVEKVEEVFLRKGLDWFTKGEYNLNLFGVRSTNSESNKFDDWFGVAWRNEKGHWFIKWMPCTTDPGKHWLLNPMNVRGTAILVPGQYRNAYYLGIHGRSHASGGYVALEQKRPMRYVRDNNRDSKLDFSLYKDPNNIFEANLKTNIHRASSSSIVRAIERYSAGCQVLQSPYDFKWLIELCKTSIEHGWSNSFTYTLLEEKDFDGVR